MTGTSQDTKKPAEPRGNPTAMGQEKETSREAEKPQRYDEMSRREREGGQREQNKKEEDEEE